MIFKTSAQRRWCVLIGFVVIMATGCAGVSSRSPVGPANGKTRIHPEPQSSGATQTPHDLIAVERQLRSRVRQWKGTPHRMGGRNRQGVDCSGFVQRLYQDIFNRKIPRSTELQVKSGRPVGKNQLRTGDLVFFRLPHKGRHVGIYLSRSEFAHASTSKGVTISSLQDDYWHHKYWTSRRYLDARN